MVDYTRGITVITNRGVPLKEISDYVHFPLFSGTYDAQFPGVPSFLLMMMLTYHEYFGGMFITLAHLRFLSAVRVLDMMLW